MNISSAKNIVSKMLNENFSRIENGGKVNHSPIYIHSSPGLGKSSIVRQTADELGIGFVDLRLAAMEPSVVQGIPYVSNSEGEEDMNFSTPSWWPEENTQGILFLDELSNAPVQTQHAAYRLVLDRQIQNGNVLPDGWVIVAAGNLKTDKTGVKGVAPALANRFGTHLEVQPSLEAFRSYAMSKGLNSQILGFLSFKPDMLFKFDPSKSDVAFPTPRTWEQVNYLLEIPFEEDEMAAALSGCVGEGPAAEFQAFQKYYSKLPNFERIMAGKEEYTIPSDLGVVFAVTTSLIDHMRENYQDDEKMQNLGKILKQLDDEFLVLFYKMIRQADNTQLFSSVLTNTMDSFSRVRDRMSKTNKS